MKTKKEKIKSYDTFSDNEIEKIVNLKLTEIIKIYKWKKCARDAGVEVDIDDYMNHPDWNKINSTYDINFYKIRYSKYDYNKIHSFSKLKMVKKRGSMYDPENIAKRKNISIDDAIIISQNRKKATKITKENLINKYGEEIGSEKYKNFLDKSKSTIDNYKKRYGDAWRDKWNYFLSTRDSSSLEYFKIKYGEDGERLFEKKVLEFKKSSNIEYYKEKYGESEGIKIYNEINLKKAEGSLRSWSFEEFKKNNKEKNISNEELKKIFNLKMKKRNSRTIEYFLQKGFSLDEAKELRLKSIETLYRGSGKGSSVSKESIRFFSALEGELNRKCRFGSKKDELSINVNDKIYFFDFFDKETNTIIEYNGSVFHAPDRLSESERNNWKSKYGLTWDEVSKKDFEKINAAKSAGYNIFIVWDYEVRSNTKLKEKINNIASILRSV